jgi:hypothetical protein
MTLQKNPGAVRRYTWLLRFASWLQSIPSRITPPPFRLVQIGSAFWQSCALHAATRLDIATVLGDDTLDADEIAHRVSAQPDATYRLLRMLAALGVFEETAPRRFRNNRLSTCLREDDPHSVRAMILMHNSAAMSRPWYEHLEQGIRGGGVPFELTHDETLVGYMDTHPDFDALFSSAMDSVEALAGDSFATDFDWGRFARVIDVGGSKGSKALAILKRHPHLKALVTDRAGIIAGARAYWNGREDAALLARMEFQAGDVLEAVPAARDEGDIYLLSAVLHGFDDGAAVRALGTLAAATAGTGARIALLEMVLPEAGADFAAAAFDMQMFMGTGGRERTLEQWQGLFRHGGVVLEEVVSLQSFGKLLVLRAAG